MPGCAMARPVATILCMLFIATVIEGHLVEITVGVFMETADYPDFDILNTSLTKETVKNASIVYTLSPTVKPVGHDAYSLTTLFCKNSDASLFVSFLPCDVNIPLSHMIEHVRLPVVSWNVCETSLGHDWPIAMTSAHIGFRSVTVEVIQRDKWRQMVFICDQTADMTEVHGIMDDLGRDRVTLFDLEHDLVFEQGQPDFWMHHTNYVVYCSKENLVQLLKRDRMNRLDVLGPRYKWLVLNLGKTKFVDVSSNLQEGDNIAVLRPYQTSTAQSIRSGATALTDVLTSLDAEGYMVNSSRNCSDIVSSDYFSAFLDRMQDALGVVNRTGTVYSVRTYTHRRHGAMGLAHVGNWTSTRGLRMWAALYPQLYEGFNNRTFFISTIQYEPFMIKQPDGRWTGLLVEFLEELRYALNFSYVIQEARDNVFGRDMGNGSFSGIVGVVQRKEADFALAPMTILHDRAQVVDFTTPYWNDPYIVLLRRPDPGESMIFICLGPFSAQLWGTIAVSVTLVSVVLWISLNFYPGPRALPTVPGLELLKTSFWQTFGALMQQGMVDIPVITSGRLIVAMWWFYVIILAGAYNGNLIAFLTAPKADLPVDSLEGLANSEMLFGTLRDAAFHGTLASANSNVFSQLWNKVKDNVDGLFYMDSDLGLERVLREKDYAYIIEASYYTMLHVKNGSLRDKQCEFARPKEDFLVNMYGLAFQKNSPYTSTFSLQILRILEAGFLERIKHKWLSSANRCTGLERVSEQTNIGLLESQGAFYLLGIGIVAAMLVLLVECLAGNCKCRSKIFRDIPCAHVMRCERTRNATGGVHVGHISAISPPEHSRVYQNGDLPLHDITPDDDSITQYDQAFDSMDGLTYIDIFSGKVTSSNTVYHSEASENNLPRERKSSDTNGVLRRSSKIVHSKSTRRSHSESIQLENVVDIGELSDVRDLNTDSMTSAS